MISFIVVNKSHENVSKCCYYVCLLSQTQPVIHFETSCYWHPMCTLYSCQWLMLNFVFILDLTLEKANDDGDGGARGWLITICPDPYFKNCCDRQILTFLMVCVRSNFRSGRSQGKFVTLWTCESFPIENNGAMKESTETLTDTVTFNLFSGFVGNKKNNEWWQLLALPGWSLLRTHLISHSCCSLQELLI